MMSTESVITRMPKDCMDNVLSFLEKRTYQPLNIEIKTTVCEPETFEYVISKPNGHYEINKYRTYPIYPDVTRRELITKKPLCLDDMNDVIEFLNNEFNINVVDMLGGVDNEYSDNDADIKFFFKDSWETDMCYYQPEENKLNKSDYKMWKKYTKYFLKMVGKIYTSD